MIRRLGKMLLVLVAGTLIGFAVAGLTVWRGAVGEVSDGPWRTNPAIGSLSRDIRTRAAEAVDELFALSQREAIDYTAVSDSRGEMLDGGCRYAVTGDAPDARWWTITAYGGDGFLMPNPARRYSVANAAVTADARGVITVLVGGAAAGDAWIPVGSGRFSLTLRLYNPGLAARMDPAHAALPTVEKLSCP